MNSYIFKGHLCGYICPEYSEPLSNLKIRLYRLRGDQDAVALAVANPKYTLALISNEQVDEKAEMLLAEVETDSEGRFTFVLGEKQNYNGEAFEVDVYCDTVPRQKPGWVPPKPLQFNVTTVQPLWRHREDGAYAVWDYCLPHRFWCGFRSLFGAWTICGKIVTCDKNAIPVTNVKVSAFDTDWIQDDPLGSAITDGDGKFRIDYNAADFQKSLLSPLINLVLTGGPDIYFKIETYDGQVVLNEPSSRGRQRDRENAGQCFCVTLCVDMQQHPPI